MEFAIITLMADVQEWYADGLSFTCTQCGNCCTGSPGYVMFDEKEARDIAEHLGISVTQFRSKYTHTTHGVESLQERKGKRGYDCVFLKFDKDDKALCSVYPVRPTQCRTWPFWSNNLQSPRDWQHVTRICPGSGKGQFYPIENIRILRDRTPDL